VPPFQGPADARNKPEDTFDKPVDSLDKPVDSLDKPAGMLDKLLLELHCHPLLITLAANFFLRFHSLNPSPSVREALEATRRTQCDFPDLQPTVSLSVQNFAEVIVEVKMRVISASVDVIERACMRMFLSIFRLSFFHDMDGTAQDARHLAAIMSMVPEAGAPLLLFEPSSNLVIGDGASLFREADTLNRAVAALADCGLVQRSWDDQRLLMHATVQAAVQQVVQANALQSNAASVGSALWNVVQHEVNSVVSLNPSMRSKRLLPLAVHLGEQHLYLSQQFQPSAALLRYLCGFLSDTGVYINQSELVHLIPKAESLLQRALEIAESIGSSVLLGSSLNALACLIQAKDPHRYDEAEKLHFRALEIRERAGERNEVAESLHNIASLLKKKGLSYFPKAEEMYRRSLEIRKVLHSNVEGKHPDVARSLSNLAALLEQNGEQHYAEAEPLYQQALDIFESLHFGTPHADVADVLNNFASFLYLKSSQQIGVKVQIEDQSQHLGQNRPQLQAQSPYSKAEAMFRRALMIREELHLDVEGRHPAVASALNNLALLLEKRGPQFHDEVEALYKRARDILEFLHSDANGRHADVANTLNNLAVFMQFKGPAHYEEAEALLRKALEIRNLLQSDADIADSLNNLALLLFQKNPKYHAEAETLISEAVVIREKVYSNVQGRHLDVIESNKNLARLRMYRRAMQIRDLLRSDVQNAKAVVF
jgi:tetratricopeptide (TPR) repeat protein